MELREYVLAAIVGKETCEQVCVKNEESLNDVDPFARYLHLKYDL